VFVHVISGLALINLTIDKEDQSKDHSHCLANKACTNAEI
jgi:hypothetical protein